MNRELNMETFLEHDFRMEAVEAQRNRALADHAIAVGKLRIAETRLKAAQDRVAELEARVEDLTKPKEA